MDITIVSASKLKRNVAEIINAVHFGKTVAVIERYGKPVVKIVNYGENQPQVSDPRSLVKKYFGVLPDFPDVTKERKFKKRNT